MQEGRGAGFVAKALDRMLVQASGHCLTTFDAYGELGLPDDRRAYGAVAAMARLLRIRAPLRLLSNNPEKVAALRAAGVHVGDTETIAVVAVCVQPAVPRCQGVRGTHGRACRGARRGGPAGACRGGGPGAGGRRAALRARVLVSPARA
jgi:hypothetical protein